MSGIRSRNTTSEWTVRKILHHAGFRFRLHVGSLPGRPDIVLPRWKAVIHVHGCFWHGHDCHFFRVPATDTEKWLAKFQANRRRDDVVAQQLEVLGWRQLSVWECALRGRSRLPRDAVAAQLTEWLQSGSGTGEIRGVSSLADSG